MAKRVAITIAGAVSLGSYEAGVVYELLEAFRTYNQKADGDTKIYVDVITGASAGGMTAAMLAEALMFNGASLGRDPVNGEGPDPCAFTNPLYQAWVEKIDIRQLVELWPTEKKWHSLLSSDLVTRIGTEMLVDSMKQPRQPPHAAVELDSDSKTPLPLDLGLALTNLTGVDYMLRIEGNNPDGGFNYTTSVDQKLFKVTKDGLADGKTWAELRDAAVVCGAFPAAFRTQALSRKCEDYGEAPPQPPAQMEMGKTYVDWGKQDPKDMVYCDGGVLQNQPLGIAKNFVDVRKSAAPSAKVREIADDRLYVFVSPHAVKSSAETKLLATKTTIAGELVALVHTYIRQAMFHDWITAEGMNKQVRLLDKNASDLAWALANGKVKDVAALQTAASELNALLLQRPQALVQADGTVETVNERLDRLQAEYSQEYGTLPGNGIAAGRTVVQEAFLQTLATLEAAAQLDVRDTMNIVAVIADGRSELAGSGISAFAGFFSSDFRKHDYWMGRVKTRVYLQRADVKAFLKVTEWPHEGAWGGSGLTDPKKVEEEVKEKLPNPTKITKLPLSFGKMMGPGWKSLLWMVAIRPALLWSAGALVLLTVALGACAVKELIHLLHQ